jgi:hypothetical protein
MSRNPMDVLLDAVEWEVVEGAAPDDDGMPYATHTGVLVIAGMQLRCFQLNDGRRMINAEDVNKFFGLEDGQV